MTDAAPTEALAPAEAEASPRGVAESLHARGSPLAPAATQLRRLAEAAPELPAFAARLAAAGLPPLRRAPLQVFQVNLGKLCNMTCRHCHVDAGPDRAAETMSRETLEHCLAAIDRCAPRAVDLTGGAPELNPHFRWFVAECASRGLHVMDRCNLTVLTLARFADLPSFFAEHGVEVVASLPHWRRPSTDKQRGEGTFDRSVDALRRLNAVGYGAGDPKRTLTLVHNPVGAFLPSGQASMEKEWKIGLLRDHGVRFDRLIALNNMPIARFLDSLDAQGTTGDYLRQLHAAFNPAAVPGLMCRDTVSIGWDGRVFDCDFNQMLELPVSGGVHVRDLSAERLGPPVTERHCFGCTAGAGSSCGGATT